MSPFETAYFELYISDGLHNMKNMRTSNFFLGLTIFLLAACSSSIDEDLDIKKDVDDPVSEKTFSLLSVDVGYIENADAYQSAKNGAAGAGGQSEKPTGGGSSASEGGNNAAT